MNQRGWESLLKKCSKADEEEDMDSEASGDAPAAKPTKPKVQYSCFYKHSITL